MSKLRIGLLGAARIATPFIAGAKLSSRAEVVAVASRDRGRAQALADTHGVPHAMTYEQLLAAKEIDAVYIPLPNSLHAPWSIAAARAGKHVLCEKPLALSEAEALEMFSAADAAGIVLLEGYPFLFQPQTLEIERRIQAGEIGRVQTIFATCGFTLSNPDDFRLDPTMGGGALLDAGCYPVSLIRQITGARPTRVTATAQWHRGVDQTLAATLEFASGTIAQLSCSFASGLVRTAVIAGSDGIIETDYSNHTIRSPAPTFGLRRGSDWRRPTEAIAVPREDGFRLEIDAFAAMIDGSERDRHAARRAASIDVAWTLEAILARARAVSS
ncbi:Gfo/Idh/MocA family protein [Peristeroidobacter agariperforans]|uniref:Gfo/Idh/MocA family protein n=1 Tax=Peristeroidobacter agariperforans TaxID=268404 RepID=UPI00101D0936|nr:Gfo/Idh/MocA family oxidoreductase [Peristeroidobacter agariperforans]